jgi:Putative peptidoglycan binding domain
MKMQFLLIGLISIALFGVTPVVVAHGHSGGGGGHGGGGAGHGHGGWGGHGRGAWNGQGHGAWRGHGRVAWGGYGHRFHHGGRFFGPGFGFYGSGYPWWWGYPGYPDYPYPSQDYDDSYYGDTYYGNAYYGNSDPHSSATKSLQAALAQRGYYHGSVDGVWGPQTRKAIRSFQADQGLPVTGQVDGRLIRALQS